MKHQDNCCQECSPRSNPKCFTSVVGETILAMASSKGFVWLFHNPYCGFLFRCGCTWNWLACGGWCPCNVHNNARPWCPWCMAPTVSRLEKIIVHLFALITSGHFDILHHLRCWCVLTHTLTHSHIYMNLLYTQDYPAWAWTVNDKTTIALMMLAWLYASLKTHRHTQQLEAEEAALQLQTNLLHEDDAFASFSTTPNDSEEGDHEKNDAGGDVKQYLTTTTSNSSSKGEEDGQLQQTEAVVCNKNTLLRMRNGSIAAIIMFWSLGFVLGFAFWIGTGYPYFLWFTK
jgi:hypothetical protein